MKKGFNKKLRDRIFPRKQGNPTIVQLQTDFICVFISLCANKHQEYAMKIDD